MAADTTSLLFYDIGRVVQRKGRVGGHEKVVSKQETRLIKQGFLTLVWQTFSYGILYSMTALANKQNNNEDDGSDSGKEWEEKTLTGR